MLKKIKYKLLHIRNILYDYIVHWFILKVDVVMIKDIELEEYNPFKKRHNNDIYDWNLLVNSIRKYGILNKIIVKKTTNKNFKYTFSKNDININPSKFSYLPFRLIDGWHRVQVLRYLYGEHYKIKIYYYDI